METSWLMLTLWICTSTWISCHASVNVAFQKHTRQSSNFPEMPWLMSSRAVDGCLSQELNRNCCSHTNLGQPEAWWQVDLGEMYIINKIQIHFSEEASSDFLQNYTVFLSNISQWENGEICNVKPGAVTPSQHIKEHSCFYTARYVTINRIRRTSDIHTGVVLQLCEVLVYGCQVGKYGGNDCLSTCTPGCKEDICHPTSGECIACKPYYYGSYCSQTCPSRCHRGFCDFLTGLCEECATGFYGDRCQHVCSVHCSGGACSQTDGDCKGCLDGKYGRRCEFDCHHDCQICSQSSGGCVDCVRGYYGINCTEKCSGCSDGCDITGNCKSSCIIGYMGQRCDEEIYVPVIVSVAGALLIVTALVLILYLRRGSSKHGENDEIPIPESFAPLNTACRSFDDTTDISVEDFITMVKQKSLDMFEKEFKEFPAGMQYAHDHATNDHSRVSLSSKEPTAAPSDYINANYIKNVDVEQVYMVNQGTNNVEGEQVYVATQGPKSNTIDDFWKMVWQLESGKIVMLTNLVEMGKVKCCQYWPSYGHPKSTSSFELVLESVKQYSFYVIRIIQIVELKTLQSRKVLQFHFTTWPDHGTPDPQEIVQFHRRVISSKTNLQGQMIVHCSAGIGRTGTFIALDALYRYGKENSRIDLQSFITSMRQDRTNMVQTPMQYVSLHRAVVEAFTTPSNTLIAKENFVSYLCGIATDSDTENKTQIEREFELLTTMKPVYSCEDYKTADMDDKDKNRTVNILPVEKYRVHLTNTNYINAIFVPTFTSRTGLMVTQIPLPDTLEDFWSVIHDYCITNILVFDNAEETSWLPDENGSLLFEKFTVVRKQAATQVNSLMSTFHLVITDETSQSESALQLVLVDVKVPDTSQQSKKILLKTIYLFNEKQWCDNKYVLVVCKDGVFWCGLFCLLTTVKQQLEMDNEIDIFQAAKRLQIRRPQFFSTVEEYQMCYDIMKDYIQASVIYENV